MSLITRDALFFAIPVERKEKILTYKKGKSLLHPLELNRIAKQIFAYLTFADFTRVRGVCHTWSAIYLENLKNRWCLLSEKGTPSHLENIRELFHWTSPMVERQFQISPMIEIDYVQKIWRGVTTFFGAYEPSSQEISEILHIDNEFVSALTTNQSIYLWDRKTGEQLAVLPFCSFYKHQAVVDVIYLNRNRLITQSTSDVYVLWDIQHQKPISTLIDQRNNQDNEHEPFHLGLQVTLDNKILVGFPKDRILKIWNTDTGELDQSLDFFRNACICSVLNSSRVIFGTKAGYIHCLDMSTGQMQIIHEGQPWNNKAGQIRKIIPLNEHEVLIGTQQEIYILDVITKTIIASIRVESHSLYLDDVLRFNKGEIEIFYKQQNEWCIWKWKSSEMIPLNNKERPNLFGKQVAKFQKKLSENLVLGIFENNFRILDLHTAQVVAQIYFKNSFDSVHIRNRTIIGISKQRLSVWSY